MDSRTRLAAPTDTISGPEFRAYMADMARTVSRLASQVESLTDSVGTIADQISDDSEQTKSTARDTLRAVSKTTAAVKDAVTAMDSSHGGDTRTHSRDPPKLPTTSLGPGHQDYLWQVPALLTTWSPQAAYILTNWYHSFDSDNAFHLDPDLYDLNHTVYSLIAASVRGRARKQLTITVDRFLADYGHN